MPLWIEPSYFMKWDYVLDFYQIRIMRSLLFPLVKTDSILSFVTLSVRLSLRLSINILNVKFAIHIFMCFAVYVWFNTF